MKYFSRPISLWMLAETLILAGCAAPAGGAMPDTIISSVTQPCGPSKRYEDPMWSPDGSRIAYSVQGDDSLYRVLVTDKEGKNEVPLTDGAIDSRLVKWTSDGRHLVFTGNELPGIHIFTMGLDGGGQTRLTGGDRQVYSVAWSPDGRHVAFMADRLGVERVMVADADGRNITQIASSTHRVIGPKWSPDGRRIVYAAYGHHDRVYVVDIASGRQVELTDPSFDAGAPDWSPDGRLIAVDIRQEGGPILALLNADGSGRTIVSDPVSHALVIGEGPLWSPDGKRIAFLRGDEQAGEIYVVNSDGSNVVRLTNTDNQAGWPDWSPDGKSIVFARRDSGEAYRIDVDGRLVLQLTANPASQQCLRWPS